MAKRSRADNAGRRPIRKAAAEKRAIRKVAAEFRAFEELKFRVKELRKIAPGLSASDGYDLRRPEKLTRSRVARINRLWKEYGPTLVQPHDKVAVRTPKARKRLAEFTGKEVRKLARLKAVPVPKPTPKSKVSVEDDRVVIRTGAVKEKYYLADGKFRSHAALRRWVAKMAATMPRGDYIMVIGEHESINHPTERDALPYMVERWLQRDTSLRFSVDGYKHFRGFRFIGATESAAARRLFSQVKSRRKLREQRAEQSKKARAASEKKARKIFRSMKNRGEI